MLNRIIYFSIKNKLIIGLFLIALVGYGSYQFTQLPIDAVPDITDNQVQVITVAPSFGATDIERLVTFPIEQANNNIAGLKEIRSFSRFGLSLVTIVFNDETNIYWARQQVSERLQQVQSQIPQGIGTPVLGPITTGLGEIYQYVIKPKQGYENKFNVTDLRTMQDWIVRRQLLGVKGVAEVSSFGGKLKQYHLEIDPNKLQSYNINIGDVFKALENNNQNTGGAYIEKGPTVLYIRSEGLIGNMDDIKNIAIKNLSSGEPLFIRDIADVKIGSAVRYGAMCYNDDGEVAGAVVMMLKGANSSEVIKNVKERIQQIQKTLPDGVVLEPFLDRTKMVNNAISTVQKNLLEGALIVVFVLFLFLGNFRAGFIVASVIPLAMLFAIILMNFFGVSGNLMSLGALDFGLIVDGAVIIVEGVMHTLTHSKKFGSIKNLSQSTMDEEVNLSAGKMMNSAVFGQIIILVVYLPIFTLQGIEGKMFIPMAQTVAFALLGAFVLSLTYIPMMSAVFLSKTIQNKPNFSDKLMQKVERAYQAILNKVIMFPRTVIAAVLILFAVSIAVLLSLGGEFIPALEEGDFAVDTRVLTGSNLSTTIVNTQKAAHILRTHFSEVEKIVTKIGSGEVPTDPMPMEASDMMIILKDKKEWKNATSFNELSEKMSKALEEVPGITAGFQFPVQMRFNELMTGARQDVVCKIFGENLDTLSKYANLLSTISNKVEGIKNIYVEPILGNPQLVIKYNRSALAQFNLNINDVNKIVNTSLAGQTAGIVFEGEKRFDLVVKIKNELKKNIQDINSILIPMPNGSQVPLQQIAAVTEEESPNQIQREDAKRRIVVGFNVRNVDVETVVHELQKKLNTNLKLPTGYYITYGGSFENLNAAKQRLFIAVPVSLLLIFVLLYFAFNSIKQGLLIYTAIPLSAIGGILFLALRGLPFSISAGIGFIALFGVAVLNGIVLIAEFNRLKQDGLTDIKRIILMGTKVRLRPILMTAFVASLGFFPMAISNGAGAEVQRPLATVVIGGLLIATFLTLFVLPILYMIVEGGFKKIKVQQKVAIIVVICFGITFQITANAQPPISLKVAIDIALRNNLTIKNEQLKVQYQQALIGSATNINATNFSAEYGKMNSAYNDTKFLIAQGFALPKLYQQQKQFLTAEWNNSLLSVKVNELVLKKQVTEIYCHWQYLLQKQILLIKLDSLYQSFYNAVKIKLQKGETNVLEKAFAETNLLNITNQKNSIEADLKIVELQFQMLLNTTANYTLKIDDEPLSIAKLLDTAALHQHPTMQQISQKEQIAKAMIAVDKAKLLPEFSLGYNNSSIKGFGADDQYYASSERFGSVQLSMAIPVFANAQKAKIKSSEINLKVTEATTQIELKNFHSSYKIAVINYNKQLKIVEQLKSIGLLNINIINTSANLQFANGNINFLEWGQLMHQAINIENDYIEAVKSLNEAATQVNYFNN